MNEMMTWVILSAFDVIILIFGIYMIVAAFQMKNTKELGKIILTEEEVHRCTDKVALADFLYKREAVTGCVFLICGAVRLLSKFLLKLGGIADKIVVVVLLVAAFWFLKSLQTARAKFL